MRDGHSKKNKSLLLILVILFSLILSILTPCVNGGIKLWPAKLEINISDYPREEIQYNKISVENPYSYEVDVITEIDNPTSDLITEGYSNIPDLSWVKIIPDVLTIPPESTGFFTVEIDVPENQKSEHYNENWEVWAIFYRKSKSGDGSPIQVKLASKLLIHTPTGEAEEETNPYNVFIVLFVIGGIFFSIIAFYILKDEKRSKTKKTSVYFFRKRKS